MKPNKNEAEEAMETICVVGLYILAAIVLYYIGVEKGYIEAGL